MSCEEGLEIFNELYPEAKDEDYVFNRFTVECYIYSPTRRSFDPPNLYPSIKALIDGLTDAQWWEDDNHEFMEWMRFRHGGRARDYIEDMDPKSWIIRLEIEEVSNND